MIGWDAAACLLALAGFLGVCAGVPLGRWLEREEPTRPSRDRHDTVTLLEDPCTPPEPRSSSSRRSSRP